MVSLKREEKVMSTTYTLLLAEKASLEKVSRIIQGWMQKAYGAVMVRESGWGYNISCKSVSLSFTKKEPNIKLMREEYLLPLGWIMSYEVYSYSGTFQEAEDMLRMIGMLLRQSTSDCFLLAMEEIPIMRRENGHVTVDDRNWDSREVYPYKALGIDFEWGTLPYGKEVN